MHVFCACRNLRHNGIKREGAAALAPALHALTRLTRLELNENDLSWAELVDSAHPLLPLLTSLKAAGCRVGLC